MNELLASQMGDNIHDKLWFVPHLKSIFGEDEVVSVMDFGCADGQLLLGLVGEGNYLPYGVESDLSFLVEASKRVAATGRQSRVWRWPSEVQTSPHAGSSSHYDVLVLSSVLHENEVDLVDGLVTRFTPKVVVIRDLGMDIEETFVSLAVENALKGYYAQVDPKGSEREAKESYFQHPPANYYDAPEGYVTSYFSTSTYPFTRRIIEKSLGPDMARMPTHVRAIWEKVGT